MKICVRSFAQPLWGALLVLSPLMASQASAVTDTCKTEDLQSSYQRASNDIVTDRSLAIMRPFNGDGEVTVAICAGEVRILPSSDGNLHLSIVVKNRPKDAMDAFVRKVETQDGKADISLAYPKELHPFIVLKVPSSVRLHSAINLAIGHLDIRGDALRGDREINVGVGHVVIFLRGDAEYSELVASVGMGSFHDRRPQGTSKDVSGSRKQPGHGNGQIVASVGVGSIEVRPEE